MINMSFLREETRNIRLSLGSRRKAEQSLLKEYSRAPSRTRHLVQSSYKIKSSEAFSNLRIQQKNKDIVSTPRINEKTSYFQIRTRH